MRVAPLRDLPARTQQQLGFSPGTQGLGRHLMTSCLFGCRGSILRIVYRSGAVVKERVAVRQVAQCQG